jgi:hypothetical protein
MKVIETRIEDRQFTKLIRKSLNADYFEFGSYKHNIIGTPQGSILSPILANIFLHQFDVFIALLKAEFDMGTKVKRTRICRKYEYHIAKARSNGNSDLVSQLIPRPLPKAAGRKERSNHPAIDYHDPTYKRLNYVRYADNWLVGIRGSYEETKTILDKITVFSDSIGLKISTSQTKITNLNLDKGLFLGTSIFRANHRRFIKIGANKQLKRNKLSLRLQAPLDKIAAKLRDTNFIKYGKAAPKFLWLHNDHNQIISLYNSVVRGYLNYYSFAHNYG